MRIKCIIFLYLFIIVVIALGYPTVSFPYIPVNENTTQYIIDLSKDIQNSIQAPDRSIIYSSNKEVKLRLFLSPWGELKDVYISESSGNKQLDSLCLKAARAHERYQPFPEELGDKDRWIDIPIVFKTRHTKRPWPKADTDIDIEFKDEWLTTDKKAKDVHILGVEDAVDMALENHMAARIAQEEIELTKLKIREARRALYPSASLNYMETVGRTTTNVQDFTDKEYKIKFEYPLYYGWRLRYAVDQAIINMKASRHSYDKVLQDLRGEVETAFYSYLATKVNTGLQRSLLKEVKSIANTAKKRFDLELSTKAEFMKVESQLKQIAYQLTSSESDLTLAKIVLAQAMNIEGPDELKDLIDMDIDLIDLSLPYMDITLEECMDLAFRNRPDLKAKEYMVEFNEYERKIAANKDQLKVDLTGSYGKSGGAFESETLNMDKDWYLGIKVSKPIGGNTLSTGYTKDETSEKHGQTSRTESASKSLELGILNNLQSFSEKKTAEIALRKSKNELKQVKDLVFRGIKEQYLNYQKGIIQAETSLNKIKYREEELKIAKARVELNELTFSEFVQAHVNLTDEKSFYIEAVGSLYQSLLGLNKATGYALFLDTENFKLANAK
ncbi:TonB family protein [Candidatus Omnitrophota bacterium]